VNNNSYGIYLYYSNNNLIENNLVKNNSEYGIYLYYVYNNLIYHNNFKNNTNQAYDYGSNYWDNGYPSGGNYWSDYTGMDNYRGENQNIPGSDGICDTSYNIYGGGNKDRYPLMNPILAVHTEHVSLGTTIVDGRIETDTMVTITTNQAGSVTVVKHENNPGGSPPSGFTTLGKYVEVRTDIPSENIVWPIEIRIYYTDEEVTAAGIPESSLRIFYWDGSNWIQEPDSGVNTENNYVWARVTHLSPFAPMGSVLGGVSVSISPTSQSGANGATLNYTVTVSNTGNVDDTYDLTVSNDHGWELRLDAPTVAILAGESTTVTVSVTVPSTASEGDSTMITVTATSRADPSVSASASCRATASAPSPGPGPTPTDTTPPPAPSLVSPANGANITDNTPLLDWSDVSDPSGVTYDMSIARDAGFVSIALQKTSLTASTYELTPAEALAAGAYYWRARAVDGVGNIGSWSENWSFTVSIAPPTPPSVEIPLITPESPATIEVENAAITELEISVLNTVENVRITVQELVDRPGEIAIAAPGAIYRYLEIIKENITDNDISSVTITFKVEKSWIEGENIDENTITLKRYNPENGGWISLPTAKVSEDATYVYFSATSPGLSYFAVSGTAMTPAPAAFTVSSLTISPSQVSVGEEVSISVMVKNTGGTVGTCTVTLKINGAVKAIENVTLAGGATELVVFAVAEDKEGTYSVEVNGLAGTFTVITSPIGLALPIGIVVAIAIITIGATIIVRRQKPRRRL